MSTKVILSKADREVATVHSGKTELLSFITSVLFNSHTIDSSEVFVGDELRNSARISDIVKHEPEGKPATDTWGPAEVTLELFLGDKLVARILHVDPSELAVITSAVVANGDADMSILRGSGPDEVCITHFTPEGVSHAHH